jgi:hypothetical protein
VPLVVETGAVLFCAATISCLERLLRSSCPLAMNGLNVGTKVRPDADATVGVLHPRASAILLRGAGDLRSFERTYGYSWTVCVP